MFSAPPLPLLLSKVQLIRSEYKTSCINSISDIYWYSAVMKVVQGACEPVDVMDPSLLLRPEPIFATKPIGMFRDYSVDPEDPIKERVRVTYHKMHTYQTVDFVRGKMDYWLRFDKFQSTVMDALVKLNDLVDESDPDVDIPNLVHAFQTAERIRADYPQEDWFHLTGLLHDLGKIMAFYGEPQWAVVGDTFPVGCAWGNSIVYRQTSFKNNPDGNNLLYNTKFGIYKPNCGLENIIMSWGHDEYMYQVLKHNKTTLPEEALYMIRFHSFYPWHAGGDYVHLCDEKDKKMLHWVHEFNKYDLYTKSADVPDVESLMPYYQSLIDKYIPGEIEW
ncbi:inositol oxygenase isoform X1 [Zootermopsis nevadensis]|nr:inositol oxygenase isoform X1 [Zootermopsis nevadensis]